MSAKPRFRKERLDALCESAAKHGGRVEVDLVTGRAIADFVRPANDGAPAPAPDDDAEARERQMRASMRGGPR